MRVLTACIYIHALHADNRRRFVPLHPARAHLALSVITGLKRRCVHNARACARAHKQHTHGLAPLAHSVCVWAFAGIMFGCCARALARTCQAADVRHIAAPGPQACGRKQYTHTARTHTASRCAGQSLGFLTPHRMQKGKLFINHSETHADAVVACQRPASTYIVAYVDDGT